MEIKLSAAQKRFLFQDQNGRYRSRYNIALSIDIDGKFDGRILEQGLRALLKRHDILCVSFQEEDGDYRQIVHEYQNFTAEYAPTDFSLEEIEQWFSRLINKPVNLSKFPLIQLGIATINDSLTRLALIIPHILLDHTSLRIVAQELSLYFSEGEHALAQLPHCHSFHEYSVSKSKEFLSAESHEEIAYWRTTLAKVSLNLPFRSISAKMPEGEGGFCKMLLGENTALLIDKFSRSHNLTTFSILLSAYSLVLSRYLSVSSLIIGIPVGDRDREEYETTVGFLTNTVPIACAIAETKSFLVLVHAIQGQIADAFDHKQLPFDQLVAAIAPERTVAEQPIVQTMFGYSTGDVFPLAIPQCKVSVNVLLGDYVRFPVGLRVEKRDQKIQLLLEYDRAIFDTLMAERLCENYQAILDECLGNPTVELQRLLLLSPRERQQSRVDTETDFPCETTTHSEAIWRLFERSALKSPDTIAVIDTTGQFSYGEILRWSNKVAQGIRSKYRGDSSIIALQFDRSVEYIVSLLAILKAGFAYLPLDPLQPLQRTQQLIDDAGVNCVLVATLSEEMRNDGKILWCDIDTLAELTDQDRLEDPEPSAAAYVIYTSGSSGVPHGVEVGHASVRNHIDWAIRYFSLTTKDHTLFRSPPQNDVAVWDIWVTLSSGATIVIPERARYGDPEYICNLIREHHVTNTSSVPAFLSQLISQPEIKDCCSLRFVTCGGEAVSESLVDNFYATVPEKKLYNCYGPTEATVNATVACCSANKEVTIGKAISGVRVVLVDHILRPVPQGAQGEICIGGAGLAIGYLNNPELTTQRFIKVRMPDGRYERMYRTGDLGRVNNDGEILFQGRNDTQVKIRGYRVELSEVERVLKKLPGIVDAAASTAIESDGSLKLIAFLELVKGHTFRQEEVKSLLEKQLPNYMIPSIINAIPQLPRNAIGKIDRSSLPCPEITQIVQDAPLDSRSHAILREIWMEVLETAPPSDEVSFFDAGGHSLSAMRIVSLLKSRHSIRITIATIFETPHFGDLSRKINSLLMDSLEQVEKH